MQARSQLSDVAAVAPPSEAAQRWRNTRSPVARLVSVIIPLNGFAEAMTPVDRSHVGQKILGLIHSGAAWAPRRLVKLSYLGASPGFLSKRFDYTNLLPAGFL